MPLFYSYGVFCPPPPPPQGRAKDDDDDEDDVSLVVPDAAATAIPGPSQPAADPPKPEGMETEDDGWTVAKKKRR